MSQTQRAQIATVASTLPRSEAEAARCHRDAADGRKGGREPRPSDRADRPVLPAAATLSPFHEAEERGVECGVVWRNAVSVGIPLSPIFLCSYIPDQWTTECSAPKAAAAEVELVSVMNTIIRSWKYVHRDAAREKSFVHILVVYSFGYFFLSGGLIWDPSPLLAATVAQNSGNAFVIWSNWSFIHAMFSFTSTPLPRASRPLAPWGAWPPSSHQPFTGPPALKPLDPDARWLFTFLTSLLHYSLLSAVNGRGLGVMSAITPLSLSIRARRVTASFPCCRKESAPLRGSAVTCPAPESLPDALMKVPSTLLRWGCRTCGQSVRLLLPSAGSTGGPGVLITTVIH